MLIFIALGILCIIFGFINIIKHFVKQKHPHEIICGKVAKLNETTGSAIGGDSLNKYFTPVFEYSYGGKVYRVEHNVRISNKGKPSSNFEIGKDVEMRVYLDHPQEAKLNSNFSVNGLLYGGIICIAAGLMSTLIGVAFYISELASPLIGVIFYT